MHIHTHVHTLPLPQPSFSMLKSAGTYSSYAFTSFLSTPIWDHWFLLKLSGWLQMAIKNTPRWHANLSHRIFSVVALSEYVVHGVSLFWKLRHQKILSNFLRVWSYFNCSALKLYFLVEPEYYLVERRRMWKCFCVCCFPVCPPLTVVSALHNFHECGWFTGLANWPRE